MVSDVTNISTTAVDIVTSGVTNATMTTQIPTGIVKFCFSIYIEIHVSLFGGQPK